VSDRQRRLADDYARALEHYLAEPEELALSRAYELGRKALGDGRGVLEMAGVHSWAVMEEMRRPLGDGEREHLLCALEKFFVESLSPFEMAHRGFQEANVVLHRLNEVLEGQAKRIAYALHDEAAQLLASVHLALAEAASKLPPDNALEVQATRGLLDQIEDRLRALSHELRPPILDDLGLVAALEFLADSVSKRWGFPVRVRAAIGRDLPATVETTLYRIAQEALNNVAKHAKAKHAVVSLTRAAHHVACSIRDDGVGFDASVLTTRHGSRGLGLVEIEERVASLGGVLRLVSDQGHGTELTVEIPVEG
jgi:signal transduction histidine kinase